MVRGLAIRSGLRPRVPVPLPPLFLRPLRRLHAPVALEHHGQARVALEGDVDRVALLTGMIARVPACVLVWFLDLSDCDSPVVAVACDRPAVDPVCNRPVVGLPCLACLVLPA